MEVFSVVQMIVRKNFFSFVVDDGDKCIFLFIKVNLEKNFFFVFYVCSIITFCRYRFFLSKGRKSCISKVLQW